MKSTQPFMPLFKKFISDSTRGKRLVNNGKRISKGTLRNYENTFKLLNRFIEEKNFDLRIANVNRLNKREFLSEKRYWKKFYNEFTSYLYSNGCFDNYVGFQIRIIKAVFNYSKVHYGIL